MPVEFFTDEQAAGYGRYDGPPSRAQLDRFFFLDDADWELIGPKRRDANRLGFAVQLCTARFLGAFLTDLGEVPEEAVVYLRARPDKPERGNGQVSGVYVDERGRSRGVRAARPPGGFRSGHGGISPARCAPAEPDNRAVPPQPRSVL